MHRIDLSLFYCVILLEEHGWQQARQGKLFARSRITQQQSAEQQQFMGNKIQLSRFFQQQKVWQHTESEEPCRKQF